MAPIVPLLAFAVGACAPRLAERLREHRREPAGLPDLLGWLHLVAPGTILQKSGSFLTGWRYRGPDLAAATAGEIAALAGQLNDALPPYGDGWMFHVDAGVSAGGSWLGKAGGGTGPGARRGRPAASAAASCDSLSTPTLGQPTLTVEKVYNGPPAAAG